MVKEYFDYSLLPHNTLGLDVLCRHFIEYSAATDLVALADILCADILEGKVFHIGRGSNLLFTQNYEGTILHSAINYIEIDNMVEDADYVYVRVGSGVEWDHLVEWTVLNGWCGLENLSYIPGEVGAAAVQNIGAYGVEISDVIESITVFEWATQSFHQINVKDCDYGYRYSRFKGKDAGRYVVVDVTFRLFKEFKPKLDYGGLADYLSKNSISLTTLTSRYLRELIIDIRRSKLPEVGELGSAGSFFMNPVVDASCADTLKMNYPNIPTYSTTKGIKIPAAWLIEQCGWKGKSFGSAGVYSKQPLVLVNLGGASSEDILRLAEQVQADVYQKFGIHLIPEVIYI